MSNYCSICGNYEQLCTLCCEKCKAKIKQLENDIDALIIKWEKEYRRWEETLYVNTDYCKAILSDLKALEGK